MIHYCEGLINVCKIKSEGFNCNRRDAEQERMALENKSLMNQYSEAVAKIAHLESMLTEAQISQKSTKLNDHGLQKVTLSLPYFLLIFNSGVGV